METILAKALGQDVTKLAAQEKQLLLSRLLARLAHEIRNPLSSLDIHVQLLEEDLAQASPQLRERTASRLEIIHGELHRLENTVKQFVSLAGPSAIDPKPVDLAKIITHVADLLRPEAKSRSIRILTDVPEQLISISADAGQLTQALLNIVINSMQAVGAGGQIMMRAGIDTEQHLVWMTVEDNGPGLPAGKESAIFEPFFTTKSEGGGLGLWIVQQIASAHGGTVSAVNRPQGGAIFSMQLPLRQGQSNPNG